MAASKETTQDDVLAFIVSKATTANLAEIKEAVEVARSNAGLGIKSGTKVSLSGLSPKFLNGLKGEVKNISGKRADVALDAISTARLAGQRSPRFHVMPGSTSYVLHGAPVQCLIEAV
jgi:hypothetical protein